MPQINQYVAQRGIGSDRGGQPRARPLDATARATQDLGGAIQSAAGDAAGAITRYQAIQQQNESFLTEAAYQKFKSSETVKLNEDGQNVQPGAANFAADGTSGYETRRQEFIRTQVPPRLREKYAAKLGDFGVRLSADYATVETRERIRYQTSELETLSNTLAQEAFSNPNDVAAVTSEGIEAINESNLPPVQKERIAKAWTERAQESAWRGLLERDPEAAVAALGVTIEEPPSTGVDNVVDRIINIESGGNPNAKSSTSSAAGLGGFIDATWLNMVTRYRPDVTAGKSRKEILALKSNPELAREMTRRYTEENANRLRAQGIQVTDGNVYLAHFLGPGGAVDILQTNPDTPLASVLSAGVRNANPFLKDWTVGQLIKWANQKMTGSTTPSVRDPDQRFADLPLERRLLLANQGRAKLNEVNTLARSSLTQRAESQVSAMAANGVTQSEPLTLNDFKAAYNSGQAEQKFDDYKSQLELAQAVNRIQRMSPAQQQTLLESTKPSEAEDGDDFAREQREYETLQQAIARDQQAWAQSPVEMAHRSNPALNTLRDNVIGAEDATERTAAQQAYWEQLAADQLAKGISPENVRLLQDGQADNAVANLKDNDIPATQRVGAVRDLIFATGDQAQQVAVFRQLVNEGMPEHYASVFEAWRRGDRSAYNRLAEDAVINASDLSLDPSITAADVNQAVFDEISDPNSIGGIEYSLDLNVAQNVISAQRDKTLINNGVKRRIAAGMSPEDAAAEVSRDLFGDVQAVTGSRIRATAPADINPRDFREKTQLSRWVFNEVMRQTRDAGLSMLTDSGMSDRDQRVTTQVLNDTADRIVRDGVIRNIGDGYGLLDPTSNAFVADANGEAFVMTLDEIMALRVGEDGVMDLTEVNRFRAARPAQDPTLGQVGITPPSF